MTPLLTVTNLVKRFPAPGGRQGSVWAVNDVSFEVQEGETLGLVGESGSGKTTVGRCILKLVEPSSGQIRFRDQDISRLRARGFRSLRGKIQIVFQEPYDSLDPRRMVGEAIEEPLRLTHISVVDQVAGVREAARQVQVREEDLTKFPHELSAGVLQRVGIARAMVTSPELIVLDEPTSLLDASARAEIIGLLMELQKQTGVSYIFISHDLTTVRYISHRIAVMYLGKIVEAGTTSQLDHPIHPYSRSLLSAVLLADPSKKQMPFPLVGEIPSPIDLPTGCFLHGRCPVAVESCATIVPHLIDVGGGHEVSCIRLAPDQGQVVEEDQRIVWTEDRGFAHEVHPYARSNLRERIKEG